MVRVSYASVVFLFITASCGARGNLAEPGAVEKPMTADAGTVGDTGIAVQDIRVPVLPSCRNLPNCIEATITTPQGENIEFAQSGAVTATTSKGIWLDSLPMENMNLRIQLNNNAVVGPVRLELAMVKMLYVDLCINEHCCTLNGEGELERIDRSPEGITEGSFKGETRNCTNQGYQVNDGWFRLTVP